MTPTRWSAAITGVLALAACVDCARTRGVRAATWFAALGLLLPGAAEYLAVHVIRGLRHHLQPQLRGVPVSAVLSWYTVTYATFSLVEQVLPRWVARRSRARAVPLLTAALATSLDLLLDPYGLDRGFWEWRTGGPYAPELRGPNGAWGIPASNFVAWIGLTGGVCALFVRLVARPRPSAAPSWGPVLLLAYYLPAAAWAAATGRLRYLLASASVPAALVLFVVGARRRRRRHWQSG